MTDYIIDDLIEDDDTSFEELVLQYIFEEDYIQDCDDEDIEDFFNEDESEDYISLAEYYYSR